MDKELHDKAWNLLEAKGLKIGEKMMVRSHFASAHRDEYPFIKIKYCKGEVDHYKSEIKALSSFVFYSEEEVILANSIYEITKDNFNLNDFGHQFKYTLRLLGINSEWAK